ncbi:MAG: VWA domain-containing protein [Armatimonadetes bacterium]|nr:VWA domain-containing protein [Armatimonadota bacterium]
MIVHEYGEWHEPEKPPFTVEDVIKAIQDLMMRAHVSFDEAMRMLLARGMPMNSFLQVNGLDELIEKLIKQLEGMKQADRERYDLNGLIQRERAAMDRAGEAVDRGLERDARDVFRKARQGGLAGALHRLLELQWKLGGKQADRLEDFTARAKRLHPLEDFARGERFTGAEPLDPREARRLRERFEAIDRLEQDLRDALESGDLLRIDAERVRELLGRQMGDEFDEKREELLSRFNQALEDTGMVDTEDGIYKLTPAAARKLGTAFLHEVFELLKSDGLGKHAAAYTGEGQVESVRTRPYEFGDSLAHLDLPSSMVNALVREGAGLPIRLKASDFEVHETMGTARTAIAVLIDMSGSMARHGRFYNAKKVALALDALIRTEYPEDRLYFVGFATFAKQYRVGDIASLAPKPVTHFGSSVQFSVDFHDSALKRRDLPQYFTNTQKALEMARRLLLREESANRHIILITDGVPTAYYLGPRLKLTYPPRHETFHETLREVKACTDAGVTINTFMMTSEWEFDYHGEREFVDSIAKINGGRLFYPSPDSLTKYVLVDFMQHKRKMFEV